MEKDKIQMLHNMYNATSTDDGTGNDELETYENWLERQLLSRIEKIEQLNLHIVSNSFCNHQYEWVSLFCGVKKCKICGHILDKK